ncbi:MAG: beta-ketoacyl-ACP synthase III [Actinomycetota bacterium]
MSSAIAGLGAALPEKVLDNAELAARLDVTEEWIFGRTGISERRIAGDDQTTATLATDAGRLALKAASVEASDLDYVIVATCTPDYLLPSTAALVGAELGAVGVAAFDLNAACSGFLYGLTQASALIDAGTAKRVLVCGADVLSRITDYSDPKSSVLFGDGAGAAVMQRIEGESRVGPFLLHAEGSQPELLYVPPETGVIHMEGREVYKRAVEGMTASVRAILLTAGIAASDVDLLVAHQANARILRAVGERLGFPTEKLMTNIARVGNTSGASIPLALADALANGRLKEGDRVVLTAFGAGFTWGAGVVRWGTGSNDNVDLVLTGKAVHD